jgi:hypothetical protein
MPQLYEADAVMRMSILMHSNFTGIQHVNILYFANRGGAAVDPGDLEELEDDFGSNVLNAYLDMFPTAFELYQTDIRGVFGGVPPARSASWNENGNRIVEGDYLPPYCCSVLSFKPNIASRRWHGKNFYGGLVEADQVNGSLQPSIQTPLGAWAVAMIARHGDAGLSPFHWVVMSDPDHQLPLLPDIGQPNIDTPSAASVESYHVGSFVRTQKRRDFFRGN